jgi:hypothetical protein
LSSPESLRFALAVVWQQTIGVDEKEIFVVGWLDFGVSNGFQSDFCGFVFLLAVLGVF